MTSGGRWSSLLVLARMAVIDVTRRPWRLGFLAAGIALAGAAAFGALVFHAAIGRSLDRSLARLGADAVILPAGVTANLTPVLLSVEPSAATIPPEAIEQLSVAPMVETVALQRTLKLADASGHLPTDVVVFDAATDLTVQPWVEERLERPFGAGDVLVGGGGGRRGWVSGSWCRAWSSSCTADSASPAPGPSSGRCSSGPTPPGGSPPRTWSRPMAGVFPRSPCSRRAVQCCGSWRAVGRRSCGSPRPRCRGCSSSRAAAVRSRFARP